MRGWAHERKQYWVIAHCFDGADYYAPFQCARNISLTPELTFNKVFLQVFGLGGKAGVVAFVMITGYFMVSSSFKLHKFGKLVGQIWFYSLAMLGVAMGLGLDTVTSRNMMLTLLPIGAMSWFAQNFLVLY